MYIYYVYAYLRNKDSTTAKAGTPYYIGKGKNTRAWDKHHIKIPKDLSRIVLLETNLSNIGALALERRLIKLWGRKDLGTGILINQSDGGDGVVNISEETRNKISLANKKRTRTPHSAETRKKIGIANTGNNSPSKGIPRTDEVKQKISRANKGKPGNKTKIISEETRRKIGQIHKGKTISAEHREKLRLFNLGKKRGPYKKKLKQLD